MPVTKAARLGIVVLLVVGIRVLWLVMAYRMPSADELLFPMMAEAILQGKDFPLVVWREGYIGTLGNSWILAGLFAATGPSLVVALAYSACLTALQVWIWYTVAERVAPGAGVWVALLLAVPPPHLAFLGQALYYSEGLTIGALLIGIIVRYADTPQLARAPSCTLGFLTGYILYTYPACALFLAGLTALWRKRVKLSTGFALGGCIIGLFPLVIVNLTQRFATFRVVGARLLAVTKADFTQHVSVAWLLGRVGHQILTGLRHQPRLILSALVAQPGPLIPAGLVTLGLLLYLLLRARRAPRVARWITWSIIVASLSANSLLGTNARARFFVPGYYATALLAGVGAATGGAAAPWAAGAVVALNGWQTLQHVRTTKPTRPMYTALIQHLRARGLRYGYATHWHAVPLTWLSDHQLLVAATAADPRHIHDRTPLVTTIVDRAPEIFYLYAMTSPMEHAFAERWARVASERGINFRTDEVPPFRLYWHIHPMLRPEELSSASPLSGPAPSQRPQEE